MASDHSNTPSPHDPHVAMTPLPVPNDALDILLLGGSFDPPTLAHVQVAGRARAAAFSPGGWLVFVPAARSPFKPDPSAPDAHRTAMLKLAVDRLERAGVWTDELDRAGDSTPSYWIDTLRRARKARPEARFRFLIGADQAIEFHRWRGAHEILSLATPIVVLREPFADADALGERLRESARWSEDELALWQDAVVSVPLIPGSATEARAALGATPQDTATLDRLLVPAVLDYIREHDLYTSR